jgi:hypothetical protein
LKQAVVVLGCRFCVPRAVNTVFKAKKEPQIHSTTRKSDTRFARTHRAPL